MEVIWRENDNIYEHYCECTFQKNAIFLHNRVASIRDEKRGLRPELERLKPLMFRN